ncbi:MFS transporter [Marinilabiliaceae bacterium ANBcel2]|nr:MFS transporter [Marinilabiliaceae bacterium ANBcel2]
MISTPVKTVISGIFIMLSLGTIYAWSIYVPYLTNDYNLSTAQTQIVFGAFISIYTITMILVRNIIEKYGPKITGILAALLYISGYLLIYFGGVSFPVLFIGISLLSGIATGFGYLISISVPVAWYPQKKGLITGLVSGGFGAGAIAESYIAGNLISREINLELVFLILGITKGIIFLIASSLIVKKNDRSISASDLIPVKNLINDKRFIKLFIAIFTGTFAGLMIVGNLRPIGQQYSIPTNTLIMGITIFSVANFSGRMIWGWINDYIAGKILIPLSLILTGIFTLYAGTVTLTPTTYIIAAFLTGFIFGANFVLYANETAKVYGLHNLGKIYPFIFFGYGISGIAGPSAGGVLKDLTGTYQSASILALILALLVTILLLFSQFKSKR